MNTVKPDCKDLASLLIKNQGEQFKFEDSSMVFETDGTFIYAKDLDSGEDLFAVPEVTLTAEHVQTVFIDHNKQDYARDIILSLAGHGLYFSDQFNNSDISVDNCLID